MNVTRKSQVTGTVRTLDLDVTQEQLDDYYKNGALLQDAFPHLPRDQREFIKSGITDDEWNNMFGGLEDE